MPKHNFLQDLLSQQTLQGDAQSNILGLSPSGVLSNPVFSAQGEFGQPDEGNNEDIFDRPRPVGPGAPDTPPPEIGPISPGPNTGFPEYGFGSALRDIFNSLGDQGLDYRNQLSSFLDQLFQTALSDIPGDEVPSGFFGALNDIFGNIPDLQRVTLDQLGQLLESGILTDDDFIGLIQLLQQGGIAPEEGGDSGAGGGEGSSSSNVLEGLLGRGSFNLGPGNTPRTPLTGQILGFIRDRLRGPFGIPEDVLQAQRAGLTTAATTREAQAQRQLAQGLNVSGNLFSGRRTVESENISSGISGLLFNALRDLDLQAAQIATSDRQSAANEALTLESLLQSSLLGAGDLDLRRFLGRGNLALGQGNLNLATDQFRFDSALQTDIYNRLRALGII